MSWFLDIFRIKDPRRDSDITFKFRQTLAQFELDKIDWTDAFAEPDMVLR